MDVAPRAGAGIEITINLTISSNIHTSPLAQGRELKVVAHVCQNIGFRRPSRRGGN